MRRRAFLKSVALGSVARFCAADRRPTTRTTRTALDPAAVARELAGHRIAKIEAKRSNDRYARSLGKSRTGKGFGRGFGRQIRVLTTDQGVKGGAMSWWPDDQVRRFVGVKVSDLFDLAHGTADDATRLDFALHDLVGHILQDMGRFVAIGPDGRLVAVTGETDSSDFPVVNAYQSRFTPKVSSFVAAFDVTDIGGATGE